MDDALFVFHELASETLQDLEAELNDHPGRQAQLPFATYLLGALLTSFGRRQLLDTEIAATLRSIPKKYHRRLGITVDGHTVTYHQVGHKKRRAFKLLERKRLSLNPHENVDPATVIVNDLLKVTRAGAEFSRSLALDGTVTDSWEHPDKPRAQVDPKTGEIRSDARLGHAPRKRHGSGFKYGYEVEVIATTDIGMPKLVHSMMVHANHTGHRQRVAPLLKAMAAAGEIDRVIMDAGYYHKEPGDFAQRLYDAGIDQIFSPRAHQHSNQDIKGAKVLDGDTYCPCMPKGLVQIGSVSGKNSPPTRAKIARFEERQSYRLANHGTTGAGNPRFKCPAKAGKVRCPRVPTSMKLSAATKPTIDVVDDGLGLPEICDKGVITVPIEQVVRDRQAIPYGTQKWVTTYGRRNMAETVNSLVNHAMGTFEVGAVRTMGLDAHTILVGMLAVATNMTTWHNHQLQHPD